MIQRIQTIWLLLASACGFLSLKFSFFSGNKLDANNIKQFELLSAPPHIFILILTVAVFVAVFISIFLYNNRKLQIRIVLAGFLLSLLDIFLYYRETKKFVDGTYSFTAILTIVIPILLLMAARGIYKDEKLVKSMDRLR
jgi:hypothetical protein